MRILSVIRLAKIIKRIATKKCYKYGITFIAILFSIFHELFCIPMAIDIQANFYINLERSNFSP